MIVNNLSLNMDSQRIVGFWAPRPVPAILSITNIFLIFDINLSGSKLGPISCSLSDVICREQSVPFIFSNVFLYNSKVLSCSFHSSIQNYHNLFFPDFLDLWFSLYIHM